MKSAILGALLLLDGGAAVAQAQRVVEIDNPAIIATQDARHRLKYLASCALDENTTLRGTVDGDEYLFPGSMGLAPDWQDQPLTLSERRWVSACVLARTNAFGAHVLISMRNPDDHHEVLTATPAEMESHTLYEGAFYGDIFAEVGAAYVCVDKDHAANIPARAKRKRVCTHPVAEGSDVTMCGFVSQGVCPQGQPPVVNGEVWQEVIHVWLKGDDPS